MARRRRTSKARGGARPRAASGAQPPAGEGAPTPADEGAATPPPSRARRRRRVARCHRSRTTTPSPSTSGSPASPCPPELDSAANRERWKLEEQEHGRGPYLIELNVQHVGGLPAGHQGVPGSLRPGVRTLSAAEGMPPPPRPARVGKSYYRCDVRVKEWRRLVAEDEKQAAAPRASSVTSSTAPPPPPAHHQLRHVLPDEGARGHGRTHRRRRRPRPGARPAARPAAAPRRSQLRRAAGDGGRLRAAPGERRRVAGAPAGRPGSARTHAGAQSRGPRVHHHRLPARSARITEADMPFVVPALCRSSAAVKTA
jgi:hypothetical protein